jgi:hypothetical protein
LSDIGIVKLGVIKKIILLILNIWLSVSLILFGFLGTSLTDGPQETHFWQAAIGFVWLAVIVAGFIYGKSSKTAEMNFFYLSIRAPIVSLILLITL